MSNRPSLSRILFSWSALALGVAALLLSYFLFQALTGQFNSIWHSKLENELNGLRLTLQHQLSEGEWTLADQTVARMGVRPHVSHLLLFNEQYQVLASTRRADIGEPLAVDLKSLNFSTANSDFQIWQQHGFFYGLLPLQYRGEQLRQQETVWLLAFYDASVQRSAMLTATLEKILLLLALLALYTLGLQRIVQRQVLRPVQRLVAFTRSLTRGELGSSVRAGSSREFEHLEQAFNQLSVHLHHSMQQLRNQAMLDRAFTRAFPDVAFLIDSQGNIRSRYGSQEGPVVALQQDMTGRPYAAWLSGHDAERLEQCRQYVLRTQGMEIIEFRHDDFYIESRMAPLFDEERRLSGEVLWLIRDISEVKRKQQQIEYQANFDALTSLANRRFALLHMEKKIAHARRYGQYGAVLFIDLDHFKNINDSLGHPVGDKLLVEVGQRLAHTVRDEDMTARLGGDEFLVLFDELAATPEMAATHASECAQRLLEAIREPFNIDVHCFHLSASIGITVFPAEADQAADLVRQADTAMYHAKALGRNGFSLYTQNMQQQTQDKLNLFNDLHQAIEDEAFTLVFQPQLNHHGQVCGAEVLCRWINNGVPVRPDVFIAAAEETNLIIPLGRWILRESVAQLQRWQEQRSLPASFRRLAINISPAQFLEPQFEASLATLLQEYPVDASQLELEITESMFMGDKNEVRRRMQRLSDMGFSFALDDFGTGYSSLSYLQNLPLNKLKIDRSFITDIGRPEHPVPIINSIIQLGHNLHMSVIAEGVETPEQRDYLKLHQCHEYQGYLFSKPLPEAEFCDFLKRSQAQ